MTNNIGIPIKNQRNKIFRPKNANNTTVLGKEQPEDLVRMM